MQRVHQSTYKMHFVLCLAALSLLAGAAATKQWFTSFGEMDISTCPITYFGQKYEKAYVAFLADKFSVCFNGLYKPGVNNDCIFMSGGTADRGDMSVLSREIPTGSGIHNLLPNLKNAGECVNVIPLKNSSHSEIEQVELGNFGNQAILAIKTYPGYTSADVVTDAQVNGVTVSKLTFHANETSKGVITDVSGCRLSGVAYKINTTVWDPDTCSTITCDVSGVASAVSDCGPMERCQGNGRCALDTMCTLTGSTVIDFFGKVITVPDRCGYSLFRSVSIPEVEVLGVFKERHRKDISFLDQLKVQLKDQGVEISLQQGGRILLNDKRLALSSTAVFVHGVELYKDHKGVTATISQSNYTVSIFFNGHTAQIHVTGPDETRLQGLCCTSQRSLIEEKNSKYSISGCETKHEEPADETIDCKAVTEWCKIVEETTFSACHLHVDPEPFASACTRNLCKYPANDGLKCQFMEAYARACSLRGNVTEEGWREIASCPASSQAACQDTFCSPHEFCVESDYGGEAHCLCRAIFASKYRSSSTFGEPVDCQHESASVTLARCLLEDKRIDYSVLHLNDEKCRGDMDSETHMVKFSFNSSNTCGTVVMTNNSKVIYKNTIMTRNHSMYGLISRHDDTQIDFSCFYTQPDIRSLSIKLKHSSVNQRIKAGEWNYDLTMTAYTNAERTHRIQPSTEIKLDEKIWVELKTDGLDKKLIVVVTNSCWATNEPSPYGKLKYDLIVKGCPNPADQTVEMHGNGLGTSNYFSFNTFQFSGQSGDVYLHCKVELCVRQNDHCVPRCNHAARSRRSVGSFYESESPTLITMTWTM